MIKKNVYVIIDGMAGSCGKGKVCAEFALENNVDLAITNNMPNAGHTAVVNHEKRIFRNIPVSAVNKQTMLFLGAGSAIDMDILEEEYYNNVTIHG
jgi:adenylosuccinate synthase